MEIGDIMLKMVLKEHKKNKYIVINLIFFLFFLLIYYLLDNSGGNSYLVMTDNEGLLVTILHIIINLLMSLLSSILITWSIIGQKLNGVEPNGTSVTGISVILGVLTYGCTPCVIAFFAAIGIGFTPIILPFANLPWKIVSLLIISIGFYFITKSINNPKCKVNKK